MCERLGDKFVTVTGESTRLGAEVTRRRFQQQRQRRRRELEGGNDRAATTAAVAACAEAAAAKLSRVRTPNGELL